MFWVHDLLHESRREHHVEISSLLDHLCEYIHDEVHHEIPIGLPHHLRKSSPLQIVSIHLFKVR